MYWLPSDSNGYALPKIKYKLSDDLIVETGTVNETEGGKK